MQAIGGGDAIASLSPYRGQPTWSLLYRYRNDHPGATWAAIRDELATRFGDGQDASNIEKTKKGSRRKRHRLCEDVAQEGY